MQFLSQLTEKEGIWYSPSTSAISYPEEGNSLCYQLEDDSYWFAHRNDCLAHLINKYGNQGLFADIGGGNGFVSARLQEEGHQVVLIEPGQMGCQNAKKRGIENVVCARLEDIEWAKGELQNVGVFDVVEHIEDHEGFLRTLHSALAEHGKLFISVPSFQHLWSEDDKDAGHYRRYTQKSMNDLLKTAGFKVLYSNYCFAALHLPIYLFRTLPSKLGLRKNPVQNAAKEHGTEKGLLVRLIMKLLKVELSKIQRGKQIPFGSSLLVVAEKSNK